MTTESALQQTRNRTQQHRQTLERRERTTVDFRMIYTTLQERTERVARGADPARTDEKLVSHLDRVLRRHRNGTRQLDYLGRHLGNVSFETYVKRALEGLDLPDRELDPDDSAEFPSDGFADTLISFLRGLVSTGGAGTTTTDVTVAYKDLVDGDDAVAYLRGLVAVGAIVDLAGATIHGSEELEIEGTRTNLDQERARHVAALEAADDTLVGEDEPDPLVALDWDAPIAMVPVNLETRFVDDELLVRIYPDQIHIDTHEDQLTEAEYDWGREFWTKLWVAGVPESEDLLTQDGSFLDPSLLPDEHCVAAALSLLEQIDAGEFSTDPRERFGEIRERVWAQGVDRFGEERTAYVIDVLSPYAVAGGDDVGKALRTGWHDDQRPLLAVEEIEFPDVDLRPSTWTKTPQAALLPDRFVAFAYYDADDSSDHETDWQDPGQGWMERRVGTEYVRRVTGGVVREPLATGPSPESVAADGDATAEMEWMTKFDEAERAGMGLRIPIPSDIDPVADGFTRLVVRGVKTSIDGTTSSSALESHLAGTRYTEGLELLSPGTPTNNATEPSARSAARNPSATLDAVLGPPMAGPDTDGGAIASALGVDAEVFDHISGAGDTRGKDAKATNRALWPGTIGYYARNLLVPGGGGEDGEDSDDRQDEPPLMLGAGPSDTVEGPPSLLRWLETYREHFVEHVRGGGPLKTLRAGAQPYGLLPVSPIDVEPTDLAPIEEPHRPPEDDKRPDREPFTPTAVLNIPESEFLPTLASQVWTLRPRWLAWADDVPSVADDPGMSDEELMAMLSMEATAVTYRRQFWLLGADNPLADYAHAPQLRSKLEAMTENALSELGIDETVPRIGQLLFLGGALVGDELPITDGDISTYVDTIQDLFTSEWPDVLLRILDTDPDADRFALSSGSDISLDRDILGAVDPTSDTADYDSEGSMLRQLLLFSGLQAAIASRVSLGALYGGNPEIPAEPTAYGPGDTTIFRRFQDPLPRGTPLSGNDKLFDHPELDKASTFRDAIRITATADSNQYPTVDPALDGFLDALGHLETVSSDRLERLTTETMDLASHRLDAWWTSIATRQLSDLRDAQVTDVYVGAYGVVEDLTADPGTEAEYLLAPSLDQATTASILRSGHDSHPAGGAEAQAMAVDCSPEAVKRARPLLAAIRAGLDLPELLGYRFERGLRERSGGSSGLDLEQYIAEFRALSPGIEGKLDTGDATDETKQSDVVDGMTIYRRWKNGRLWSDLSVSLSQSEKDAIGGDGPDTGPTDSVLGQLHQTMEAVHDLLLAEGIHHLAHGRPERASAALDGLSRAKAPPEPTVLDTPRSETGVTNRLLLAFGDATGGSVPTPWLATDQSRLTRGDLPGYSGGGATSTGPIQVRHTAGPNLNTWVGDLLPGPDRIGCTGEFRWERDRTFAVGQFETPADTGPITVDVGFEPDLVVFRAVTGTAQDGADTAPATGWSQGVFRRSVGEYDAVERAITASAGDGTVTRDYSTNAAVRVTFPTAGDQIAGTVVGTTEDGFEVEFTDVSPPKQGPDRVQVSYRALSLTDPSSVRVGTYTTPSSAPSSQPTIDLAGAGVPSSGDAFSPDHVQFATAITADQSGDGTDDTLAVTEGEAVSTDQQGSTFDRHTFSLSIGPGSDEYGVSAESGATLAGATGGSNPTGLTLDVAELSGADATIDLDAPTSGTFAGSVPILFVAIESPTVDTVTGSVDHRPEIGHVSAPGSDGASKTVQTGFEPGLIEVQVIGGVTDASGSFPIDASVSSEGTIRSVGAATSNAVQHAVAAGPTDSGSLVASTPNSVAVVPTTDSSGPTTGPSVSVESVSETGFTITVSDLAGGDSPILFYRVWPAEPRTREFSRALPGGMGLDDLDLTPLDAVSITQRVEQSGDSQLERRFGYYAFRHRPIDRQPQQPPVPTDATLDLSFGEHADAYSVSVAEYVEVASAINELVGEARPADATDVSHPSAGTAPGYLPSNTSGPQGTAARLAERAGGTGTGLGGIEGQLDTVQTILGERRRVLSRDPNVCDRVGTIDDALGRFHREVPLRQVTDVADRIDPTDPDDQGNRTVSQVASAIASELAAISDEVAPGPRSGGGVTLPVSPAQDQSIVGIADADGVTTLDVTAYPLSDAVRFSRKTTTAQTDADGQFTATFDFTTVTPGTDFAVVARPAQTGPGTGANVSDLLTRNFEDPTPEDWKIVDEPPLSTQTSNWEFDEDAGILRQTSNIYGLEGDPINAPGTIAVTGDTGWTDYRLSVPLASGDNDAIGVLFRVQDTDNFYRFAMDEERNYRRLVKTVEDEPTVLWEEEAGYELDNPHEVTIEVVGDEIRGWLDGDQLFEVTDDALEHGAIGLYCRANKAARFHGVRVTPIQGTEEPPVYAATGRVVADSERDLTALPTTIADQRYLPLLLWLDTVAPSLDPAEGDTASALQSAVDDTDWSTVTDEQTLMNRVLSLISSGGGAPETYTVEDKRAVEDLVSLQALDLKILVKIVRDVIDPAAWTGLTELIDVTGDPGRPDGQSVWRSNPGGLEVAVDKHREGEIRARLERFNEYPDMGVAAQFGAYSPPIRRLIEQGTLTEADVVAIEEFLADPPAVVDAFGDVYLGIDTILADLHDLFHHVDALPSGRTVGALRREINALKRAVERANRQSVLDKLFEGSRYVWDVFSDRGADIETVVGTYRAGGFTSTPLSDYETWIGSVGQVTRAELSNRVLAAARHEDISTSFREGALASVRRTLLRASYFGIYGSVPASAAGGSAADQTTLVQQIDRVHEDISTRLSTAEDYDPATVSSEPTVDGQVERLKALLGDSFVVLPPFAPANTGELQKTLSADITSDAYATDTWLQRVSRTRDLPQSFQQIRTYADALSMQTTSDAGLRRTLEPAQLPHVPGQSWLGQDGITPEGGELALGIDFVTEASGAHISSAPGTTGPPMAGLLIDEWVERVPDASETIGLGLQYDDPSTRPPQSILLATPPGWVHSDTSMELESVDLTDAEPTYWTQALVQQSLDETMDLISIRSVDLDSIKEGGHLLPMLCFSSNRRTLFDTGSALRDAPSVDFDAFNWEVISDD